MTRCDDNLPASQKICFPVQWPHDASLAMIEVRFVEKLPYEEPTITELPDIPMSA
jgi:hypothetical protein